MSDTGSGEMPTTPRWAGVHRADDAEPAPSPTGDPTPGDAWGVRSFSPYDAQAPQTPDAGVETGPIAADESAEDQPVSDEPSALEPAPDESIGDEHEDADRDDPAQEDTSEPIADEPTEVMAPVVPEHDEPDAEPAPSAETEEETPEGEGSGAVPDSPAGNPLGVWSVVTGILLIFAAAIVLGHLGLRAAAREGRARTAAFAGMLLGYLGLVVAGTGVALWLLVFGPALETAEQELQAQADVTAVGNAVAAHFEDSATEPELSVTDTGYLVGDVAVEGLLAVDREVAFAFETTTEWCVELTYADAAASYVGATGYSATACG